MDLFRRTLINIRRPYAHWDGRTNTACFNLVVANLYSNRTCESGRFFFGVADFSRFGRCVSFSIFCSNSGELRIVETGPKMEPWGTPHLTVCLEE